jgi:serine/threonine protein kinase
MQFSIGEIIKGVWRIVEVKRGGMGIVYLCTAREGGYALSSVSVGAHEPPAEFSDEPVVALKSVSTDFYYSAANREQFDREALINVTLLPHPYIVTTQTVDRFEAPVLVMDYAPGGNLRDRIDNGPISLTDALHIFRQVCTAMTYLRSHGVLHRDLKPENILFAEAGDAQVSDFGLASIQEHALGLSTASEEDGSGASDVAERFVGGTLPYMSPEHFGVAEFSSASDVYSLGVIMFEVLAGRLPFVADSVDAYRQTHLHAKPPRLSAADGPPAMGDLIARCLEKNASRRYKTFQDLDAALVALIAKEKLDVPEPTTPDDRELEQKLDGSGWTRRGYAFGMLGRDDDCLRSYQLAIEAEPDVVGAHTNLASALARAGRPEEALAEYEKEVELHPDVPIVRAALGQAYLGRGRVQDAITQIEQAVEGDPNASVNFIRLLSAAYRSAGREADSDKMVTRIMDIMTADPDAYRAAGWVNEGMQFGLIGDFRAALHIFVRAGELYSESLDVWYNCAVTLFFLEENERATESLQHAVDISPGAPQALFLAGLISLGNGRPHECFSYWNLLIATHPGHLFANVAESFGDIVQRAPDVALMSMIVDMIKRPERLYYRG